MESFARVKSKKTAIAERGWGPLTYNLLDHDELKRKKNNSKVQLPYEQSQLSGIPPSATHEINLSDGLAGTIMDQIVEQKIYECARNETLTQRQGELVAAAQQTFNNAVKMTAGVSFKARHMVLSDGTVLHNVRDIKRRKEEKALAASNK